MNLNFLEFQTEASESSTHFNRLRPLVHALLDRVVPHGFSQLITEVTRIREGQTPALLDHLWSNQPNKLSNIQTFFLGGSDHKLILAIRQTKKTVSRPRMIRKRCFKKFEAKDFIAEVKRISWFDIYMTENVELAVELMTGRITAILDKMAPIRTIQTRSQYAPWLSEATKIKIKERNEAQKRALETNLKSDWEDFKKQRNVINNILKTEKKSWQERKITGLGSDSSSVWKNLKSWLGWGKGGPPSKLM